MEPNRDNITANPPASPPAPARDTFLTAKKFPGEVGSRSLPEAAAPAAPPKNLFSRTVLPIALFVFIIGGIAWLAQNLPNWRTPKKAGPEPSLPQIVSFAEKKSVWDPRDLDYALEMERDVAGAYDFPFHNVSDQEIEIGLLGTSCDCSKVEARPFNTEEWTRYSDQRKSLAGTAAVPKDWDMQPLHNDANKGIVIPAKAAGVIRLAWKGQKGEGQRLRLRLNLWYQPKGKPKQRQFDSLEAAVQMVHPVQFLPERAQLNVIRGEAKAAFTLWSATRPALGMKIDVGDAALQPFFTIGKVRPLDDHALAALQKKLRKEMNSHLQVAYQLEVAFQDTADGKLMDQGKFTVPLVIHLENSADKGPQDVPGPILTGTVRGDVEIGAEEGGRLELKAQPLGSPRLVNLWTDKEVTLKVDSVMPPYIDVKLQQKPGPSNDPRLHWVLELTVPPGSPTGYLPVDSAIILKTQGKTTRAVRIPISGNIVP